MNDRSTGPESGSWVMVAVAWLLVGIPMAWGVWMTIKKASLLFR